MIDRLWSSFRLAAIIAAGFWVIAAVLSWLNSMIPWWIPVAVLGLIFIVEFVTYPLFDEKELTAREQARLDALEQELEERLTEV